ncbi:TolC family protein [Lewinella sp. 4G2]|uniref:TolC family protein n=1 Tax=Lewinella sp. 4G2 TaxID=1803372 RepID=UPI0007B4F5C8|nr:TolC family protein [Lewinella sp. 4G2]OAV43092.1 hypothetical protein A3850_000625 [Lewinella sp. 4G2]
MRTFTLFVLALCFTQGLSAQNGGAWTLEKAVEYAFENNLQVRRLGNISEISRIQQQQAKNARLPTVNGSTNIGLQLGRTIDPTTNTFDQQTIGFQGYQIQGNVLLYAGGQIKNGLRQADLNLAAAETDAIVTRNTIGLQVANSYLTIVLLNEQLNNAQAQLALVENQLSNTDRLIQAGSVPRAQRFDLVAQVANAERSIVELENQVAISKLTLQLLLELDPDEAFDIATPELNPTEEQLFQDYDLATVLQAAQSTQPTIRAAQLRQEAAAVGTDLAKSGLRPTVSLFGSLSTNYSSVSKDFNNPDVSNVEVVQGPDVPVIINGMPGTISNFNTTGLVFPNLGYFDQLDRNFGQSVGAALQVPIYSQGRNKLNVQVAEVQRLNAGLDIEQARNQLRNDVQLALADLRAARQSYRAAQVSFEASEDAFNNTDRLFRAGVANSLDVVTATNRLDQARTELTRSKFQLIFNRQVIEFYLGQGLTLE